MEIIPVIVFMDIPLISTDIFASIIRSGLSNAEGDPRYKGIKDFKCHLMSIDELEIYQNGVGKIPLEDVFAAYEKNPSSGFTAELSKFTRGESRNRLLDRVYHGLWRDMVGIPRMIMNILDKIVFFLKKLRG